MTHTAIAMVLVLLSGCLAQLQSKQPDRHRVAIAPFIGDAGDVDEFQTHVTELVSGTDWELVAADDYIWTARKLDATTTGAEDVAKVAQEMKLSAVVYGKLIKKNKRRATLQVVVRDDSGAIVEKVRLRVRRGKLSKKGTRLMDRKVLAALDGLAPEPVPQPPVDEAPSDEQVASQPATRIAADETKAEKPAPKKVDKPAPKKVVAKKPAKKPEKVVAKKPAKKPGENPDKTHGKNLDLEVDDSGQVADDEWPDELK